MASQGKGDHYHREAPQPMDGDVARIQMDFMFVGAEGTFVDEPRAKATVLMVICKDDGNLSATEMRAKTDENGAEMVLRFLSTYESVGRRMGSPALSRLLKGYKLDETKQRLWHRRMLEVTKKLEQWNVRNGTVQAQLRAYYLDVQERMKVRIIPGTQLFPWILRHSVWTVVRQQSDQRTKQTPYEKTRGCRYESALVPFGEVSWRKLQTLTRWEQANWTVLGSKRSGLAVWTDQMNICC